MLKSFLSVAFCGSLLVSCTDGIGTGFAGNGLGKIAPTTDVDASVISSRNSRKEYSEVSSSDLSIKLTSADGTYSRTWSSVAAFPSDQDFNAGQYKFEAFYGDESTEGFDAPYFYGAKDIFVKENEVTRVSLTATLANAMVDISYTQAFIDYMTSYSAEVHSAGGAYTKYATTETRPVYTRSGNVGVSVEFVKPNGKGGKLEVANFTAQPRHFYHLTVDLAQGSGTVESIIVTIDESVDERTVEIDISDEVLNSAAPEISVEGFAAGESFDFIPGQSFDADKVFNIIARGGLKEVVLTTQSASLIAKGWPAEIDLVGATADQQAKLKALGLTALGIFKNPDKLAVVNFTDVLSNISFIEGGENTSTFTLVAKDKYGKVSDPVSLVATAKSVALEISNPILYVGGTELTVDLAFNGENTDAIVFKYRNSGGTWTTLKATYEKVSDGFYKAKLTVPAGSNNLTIRAEYNALVTPELVVERQPLVVPANGDVNAFATKAYLPVTIGPKDSDTQLLEQMMNNAKVVAVDNSRSGQVLAAEVDVTGKQYILTNLTPGKQYTIKIQNGDIDIASAPSKTFTTEAATQLQHAGMDEWTSEKKGDYQYLWKVANGSPWATLNALTTSKSGSGSGNGLNTGGCAYKSTSGTIPANGRSTKSMDSGGVIGTNVSADGHTTGNATLHNDKQHGGANAALIRTVGWGNNNKASDAWSGQHFGTCDNVTPGELFLGTYTDQANYGIEFSSRPSALSFYYHYDVVSSGNGDYGTAEIKVFDAAGNVIAEASQQLTEQSSYKQYTLSLNYNDLSVKAAKISVVFKSSANPAALDKSTTYWHCPGVKNVSGGEYVGSELYIDDIELIY